MTDTHSTPDGELPRTNPAPDLDYEVDTLNLMWLLGARELARSDAEKAVLVYGLDRDTLDILRHASLAMLRELAASGVLLFRPRFRLRWLQERLRTTGPSALGLGAAGDSARRRGGRPTVRLQHHAKTQLAIALIRRGMRTSLVGRISGLRQAVLRDLHHETHGCKPLPGQLSSTGSLLGTVRRQANASVFAGLYRAFGGTAVERSIDIEALLTGHRLYLEQMARLAASGTLGAPLDTNHGWVIARDLTTGLVLFRTCERCAIPYVAGAFSRRAVDCPICALKVSRTAREGKDDASPEGLASSSAEQGTPNPDASQASE